MPKRGQICQSRSESERAERNQLLEGEDDLSGSDIECGFNMAKVSGGLEENLIKQSSTSSSNSLKAHLQEYGFPMNGHTYEDELWPRKGQNGKGPGQFINGLIESSSATRSVLGEGTKAKLMEMKPETKTQGPNDLKASSQEAPQSDDDDITFIEELSPASRSNKKRPPTSSEDCDLAHLSKQSKTEPDTTMSTSDKLSFTKGPVKSNVIQSNTTSLFNQILKFEQKEFDIFSNDALDSLPDDGSPVDIFSEEYSENFALGSQIDDLSKAQANSRKSIVYVCPWCHRHFRKGARRDCIRHYQGSESRPVCCRVRKLEDPEFKVHRDAIELTEESPAS